MCDIIASKRQIIYFDVTAGRGAYDDEYEEEEVKLNNTRKTNVDENNKYHTTFKNFSDIQPKQLVKQNFNSIENQRRHSYSKPARGRAPIYNNNNNNNQRIQQTSNYTNNYNEKPLKTVLSYEIKQMNISNKQSEPATSFNWCPKRISTN